MGAARVCAVMSSACLAQVTPDAASSGPGLDGGCAWLLMYGGLWLS
jgi:hypothetical protein